MWFVKVMTNYDVMAFVLIAICDNFLEGNSANHAIELLIQKGVPESHIIFLNLISVSYYL